MADGHAIWLPAAACTTAPAPATRFGDLPPQQRKDIVRLGFLSTVAFAYTAAMIVLAQPIPSRSLHTHVALPHANTPRSALMDTLLLAPPRITPRPAMALRTTLRVPTTTVALRRVMDAETTPSLSQPRPGRRGNVFSRFFKGVWRTVS